MGQESAAARPALARTLRYDGSWGAARALEVPVEAPVELTFGGLPYVALMATPADLADLALGFCLTEGLIAGPQELHDLTITQGEKGWGIDLQVAPLALQRVLARRRNMAGRTSCGLCGVETISQLPRAPPLARCEPVASPAIARALQAMGALQPLHQRTHAVHAAAWFGRDGVAARAREDVGRHNALDKLIGACLAVGEPPQQGFLVITSRASFEMVEKAAMFGASTLVAISAPTSLAIERAVALGVTLIAVARADTALAFTDFPNLTDTSLTDKGCQ